MRPPFDPELERVLAARPELSRSLLPRHIARLRAAQRSDPERASDADLRRDGAVAFEELSIPSSDPKVEMGLLLLKPTGDVGPRPGVCFLHGGGMISGDSRTGIEIMLDWVEQLGVIVASVDYRLAPEHGHWTLVEDGYAGLCWLSAKAAQLGVDAAPLMVAGASAGAGLAAGVALLARDRQGPAISDQILMSPMLDDTGRFASGQELDGEGVWDARSNQTGWEALLGEAKGAEDVPSPVAPSRERDLSALPAAYLDVGAVEIFRDEVIDYATRLAQSGVSTELHVWAGAFHGFDVLAADSAVAKAARHARIVYLQRRLRERAAG